VQRLTIVALRLGTTLRYALGMRLSLVLPVSLVLAMACGDDGGNDFNRAPELDPSGTVTTYVIDGITVPTTQPQAREIGLDLDGDDEIDNALGGIFATVGALSPDSDAQASVDQAVADGTTIMLAAVQATSLSSAQGAGLFVLLGDNPSTPPCTDAADMLCGHHLDGATSFDVSAESPPGSLVTGGITDGRFVGGPGAVTVEVSVIDGADPLRLALVGARADVRVSESGLMSGVLAGGLTQDEIEGTVLPSLGALLEQVAGPDCTGTTPPCCVADSSGAQIYEIFDTNMDCTLSASEVAESSLVATIFALDVDLFDANGDFHPNSDGVLDALSVGVGFSGVPASFELP